MLSQATRVKSSLYVALLDPEIFLSVQTALQFLYILAYSQVDEPVLIVNVTVYVPAKSTSMSFAFA